jgi:hypothetical protein
VEDAILAGERKAVSDEGISRLLRPVILPSGEHLEQGLGWGLVLDDAGNLIYAAHSSGSPAAGAEPPHGSMEPSNLSPRESPSSSCLTRSGRLSSTVTHKMLRSTSR